MEEEADGGPPRDDCEGEDYEGQSDVRGIDLPLLAWEMEEGDQEPKHAEGPTREHSPADTSLFSKTSAGIFPWRTLK